MVVWAERKREKRIVVLSVGGHDGEEITTVSLLLSLSE